MERITERNWFTVVGEGLASFSKIVKEESHGGKVLLFTEESRRGEDVVAALTLAGLPVLRRNVTSEILEDYALLSDRNLPEGILAIVGAGGAAAMECAKGIRLGRDLPRILLPLDFSALVALDSRAFFGTKGDFLRLRSEGRRVVFSPDLLSNADHIREGLGVLLCRLAESADASYEKLLKEGATPASSLREIEKKARELANLREEALPHDLANLVPSWNCTEEQAERSDCVHVFALLAAKKTGGRYTDYLFPAAYTVLRLYAEYLGETPLEHCPPPDRSRNIALLEETCRMNATPLFFRAKEYADGYAERMRVTAEYREDFSEKLSEESLHLAALARLYRRTKKQEDESRPLSAQEILVLLSLTGEVVSGYPLLKHIKMTGLLEPLLLSS